MPHNLMKMLLGKIVVLALTTYGCIEISCLQGLKMKYVS
jgi:hypothetical protein